MFSIKNWRDGKEWLNWAGNESAYANNYELPSSIEEVIILVKRANTFKQTIRVTGAAHSFSPVAKPEFTAVSLHNLRGLVSVNLEQNEATFFAGTYLHEIGPALAKHGLALINMGDIQEQTLAGVISTGTHGTGVTLNSFSSMVTKWGIITGNGDYIEHECGEDDLSRALQLSLGLLGIIVKVTIRVVPIYNLHYVSKKENLLEQLPLFQSSIRENRHVEWYYFPGSETIQVKTMNQTLLAPATELKRKWETVKTSTLENGAFYLLSETCKKLPSLSSKVAKLSSVSISNIERNDLSYKIFPSPRTVRFVETEFAIPLERFEEAMEEIHWTFVRHSMNVHFPIECRTSAGEEGFLSPTLGRESAYLAFHMYKGMNEKFYFNWVRELMEKYEGRAHWGKVNWYGTRYANVYEQYPLADKFNELRNCFDPNEIFMTNYFRKAFNNQ